MEQIRVSRVALYFALWYGLTVVYNISNKHVLNEFPLPTLITFIQLFLGIPVIITEWYVYNDRPALHVLRQNYCGYLKLSLYHGLGNLSTVYSLQAGTVSFTHVLKALEPIFASILSYFIMGSHFTLPVYAALCVIIIGVAITSIEEVTFTWFNFISAMCSNLFYQLRIVCAKLELSSSTSTTTTVTTYIDSGTWTTTTYSPTHLFQVLTILRFTHSLTFSFIDSHAHDRIPS